MNYVNYNGIKVPKITGAGGGGKSGGGNIAPNSLFSTDVLLLTVGLGEGPLYRINPNGPQDIQIQDSSIDDLLHLDTTGETDGMKFVTSSTTGTPTQGPLRYFGDSVVSPQNFASAVKLKRGGDVDGIAQSRVYLQETSASDWDALKFNFVVDALYKTDGDNNVNDSSLGISITIYNSIGTQIIKRVSKTISGKTDSPYKVAVRVTIPDSYKSTDGYRFTIEKTTADSDTPKTGDSISIVSWDEIENTSFAYPRTALIGYAIKAANEHTGGVPNFTSLVKGLLVKVPTNYNQPILETGEVDWRQVEVSASDRTTKGYHLQSTGTETLYEESPEIYKGTWDGRFTYSWTQNPVWILYDILTNNTYGLGVPEDHIDKYKFYQVGIYCDACDFNTGRFIGVDAVADGSFRYKPKGTYTAIRENQIGLPGGTPVVERRFTLDVSITDQQQALDYINKIAATFRSIVVYSGGKLSLAVDMPEEYPTMLFNETNIKQGSFSISGSKESEIFTGVDISYVEPTNHFKREVIRIDTADRNNGLAASTVENIASIDLPGVTRRSQAIRMAQYHIASSKYIRRNISFTTSTDAILLNPGDVIAIASRGTGIAYGYGGKVYADSAVNELNNTFVHLEHFTVPPISEANFTSNTYPLALRVLKPSSDKIDLYYLSNTEYSLSTTDNVSYGVENVSVKIIGRYDPITKSSKPINSLTANIAPVIGDLWSIGEWEDVSDSYSSKAGKLFKVTGLTKEADTAEITVHAVEYVSNVYIDSDTFIDYTPTQYTDVVTPFKVPPAPVIDVIPRYEVSVDGSISIRGFVYNNTDLVNFGARVRTDHYTATPTSSTLLKSINNGSTFIAGNSEVITDEAGSVAMLGGKAGFKTPIGQIPLLCTNISRNGSSIDLTIDGLDQCIDYNFNQHVLEVNNLNGYTGIKGLDKVELPVVQKTTDVASIQSLNYVSPISAASADITSHAGNTITIQNTVSGERSLFDVIPATPFYVTINQLLDKDAYNNNFFYVTGSKSSIVHNGTYGTETSLGIKPIIELDVIPRDKKFVTLFIDGIYQDYSRFSLTSNNEVAYVELPITSNKSTEYKIVVDYYTVPVLELGDLVETHTDNVFSIASSTFDPSSDFYNENLTNSYIYGIKLNKTPQMDLAGRDIVNVSTNPIGTITDVVNDSFNLDYNYEDYAGSYNLANNKIYNLYTGIEYNKIDLVNDEYIDNLPVGTTIIRSQNISAYGRTSRFVENTIVVEAVPIRKVTGLALTESIYREQTGGSAVRVTVSFDHITEQEVTDYEVSYKLFSAQPVGTDDGGTSLTDFNTIKLSAQGAGSDGKLRYTIDNINRGDIPESNYITVRVTPLNRALKGVSAEIEKTITGKTAPPSNIINFAGGQQGEQITLLWDYPKVNNSLVDLDLKEVHIRRAQGIVDPTVENFIKAQPLVIVSAGSIRKSVPVDTFGEYTYLARTLDTSGNYSTSVVGTNIVTSRPNRSSVIYAFSEDSPSIQFSDIPNTNLLETEFPSFANSTGGIIGAGTSAVDNANGSSSGWSIISGSPTDILADGTAEYITQIRDIGASIASSISLDLQYSQAIQATFNDQHEEIVESVSEEPPSLTVFGISRIGTSTFSTTTSIAVPSGVTIGDYIFVCSYADSTNTKLPSGFTNGQSGLINSVYYRWSYRKVTSEITTITGLSAASAHMCFAFRGIDDDIFDITTVDVAYNLTGMPNPPASEVITEDSTVLIIGYLDDDTIVPSAPSGFTSFGRVSNGGTLMAAYKNLAPTGVTDPGAFTGSGSDSWVAATIVLKPKPATQVSFLRDSSFGGIGNYITNPQGRYDANNKSWMTGPANGNVWGIWNHGQFNGDVANANSYALIAGVYDSNTIILGDSYYANGQPTNSNALSNVTVAGNTYTLINFIQYDDTSSTNTYEGDISAITAQTLIRTSTADTVYFGNGAVNTAAFASSDTNDGFIPYEAGARTFKYFQFKFVVNNSRPDEYDFTLDKFRYTIDKEQTIETKTVSYDASPKTVDISSSNFLTRPAITYSIIDQVDAEANPAIAVTTAASNSSLSFKLLAANGTGPYEANGSANVSITIVGV